MCSLCLVNMNNDELNSKIKKICDDTTLFNIAESGKSIPYIGWFWRYVDFDEPTITIGNCGEFSGFMENNKWGYDSIEIGSKEVKDLLVDIVNQPSKEKLCRLYDRLQELWYMRDTFH